MLRGAGKAACHAGAVVVMVDVLVADGSWILVEEWYLRPKMKQRKRGRFLDPGTDTSLQILMARTKGFLECVAEEMLLYDRRIRGKVGGMVELKTRGGSFKHELF